ncbi:MAG: DUF4376 domain-containing protein [Candidatus Saccharibacteria bacterium]|nr:DUF4376 domain-containing protein [Rhodoferax sp.]
MKFTIYDTATGRVLYGGETQDPSVLVQPGQAVLPDQDFTNGWIADGVNYPLPAVPTPFHVFNYTTKQWEDPRTLQDRKDAKWAEIKQAREAAIDSPLITPYGVFDAYPDASANIIKSVLLANNLVDLGYPVAIDFTLADNTVVTLNATGMVQVGLVMAAREQAARTKATTLREQINSATSDVQVGQIVW